MALARQALHEAVGGPPVEVDGAPDPELERPGACFVTLTKDGELRGCIGALDARRPLAEDVRHNTRAAALEDSRFPPVTASELDRIELEVSVLSPLEPLEHEDERDLLRRLRPGVDGLVIQHGAHRATYLPQVWKSLPEPRRFLRELKIKAGLHPDFWADDMRAWRFTVESFRERPPGAAAGAPSP